VEFSSSFKIKKKEKAGSELSLLRLAVDGGN